MHLFRPEQRVVSSAKQIHGCFSDTWKTKCNFEETWRFWEWHLRQWFHRFLAYFVSLAQPKQNSTKKPTKDKTASPKVKYCIWNQHSSGSGISFSTLAQIRTTETLHNCGFSMSGTHIISFIFLYFESEVFWIISSLRFGPSSRRLRVRSLLWLDLLHFACTRESLNLRWQSTKVWNSEIESVMRKMNGCSAALCSLGLSSGGKEP